tara:strand:+ start:61 stop:609 length:549 start_codon:yes stop_codon:yes gene_type:complete
MIRNYYNEAFKAAIPAVASDTLLLDGRVKSTTPQGSWKEYCIYIGQAPGKDAVSATTATTTAINTAVLRFTPANGYLRPGMYVGGAEGFLAQQISTVDSLNQVTLNSNVSAAIPIGTKIEFSWKQVNSLKVLTIDNKIVTFENLQPGFILPISIVQILATGTTVGGNVTDGKNMLVNILALS